MATVYSYNSVHKIQRFVLMERSLKWPRNRESEIELYEVPHHHLPPPEGDGETEESTLLLSEIAHSQITVYKTLREVSDHLFTTIEEQTAEVQSCPSEQFESHRGPCSHSQTTWRSPLIKPSGVVMSTSSHLTLLRALTGEHGTGEEVDFRNIGFLETTWNCRSGSTPTPYVTIDNRRRPTQAAYVNPDTLRPPVSPPRSPILAGTLGLPDNSSSTEETEDMSVGTTLNVSSLLDDTPHPCYDISSSNPFPTKTCGEDCPKSSPTGPKYRKPQAAESAGMKPPRDSLRGERVLNFQWELLSNETRVVNRTRAQEELKLAGKKIFKNPRK